MNWIRHVLLADIPLVDSFSSSKGFNASFRQTLIVFSALAVAILVAVVLALYLAKKRRRRRHERHHWALKEEAAHQNGAGSPGRPKSRGRRRRRGSRQPNPTLAETEGLPPVRDE